MMTLEAVIEIFSAALLGGLIGIEREYRAKEAGFRTHFLVALGSALLMVISQYGFDAVLANHPHYSFDPSRIAAQVVTGIGFIGAGTIIFQKHVIRGLTTAAGLWVTSAIGMTCASGLYAVAVASTFLVLICLETMHYLTVTLGVKVVNLSFTVQNREKRDQILEWLHSNNIEVESMECRRNYMDRQLQYDISMVLHLKRKSMKETITHFLSDTDVDITYMG